MTNGSLMKVKSIAECNIFDLFLAIIGLGNHFLVFLRVVVYIGLTVCVSEHKLDVGYSLLIH